MSALPWQFHHRFPDNWRCPRILSLQVKNNRYLVTIAALHRALITRWAQVQTLYDSFTHVHASATGNWPCLSFAGDGIGVQEVSHWSEAICLIRGLSSETSSGLVWLLLSHFQFSTHHSVRIIKRGHCKLKHIHNYRLKCQDKVRWNDS